MTAKLKEITPASDVAITPPHQWTHDSDRVLILKCVSADMSSHGGFVWPASGEVCTPNWSPEPTCESGGLFGWPWGVGMGGGKEPDYTGRWIVFAAKPSDVISLDDKCKAGPRAEVVFVGTWYAAWSFIRSGHLAWIAHADQGASSATGYQGASSATGYRGASSATGDLSTIEAGNGGVAACTADECFWRVRAGAVFIQRWATYKNDGYSVSKWHTFTLDAGDYEDGVLLHIKNGKVVKS